MSIHKTHKLVIPLFVANLVLFAAKTTYARLASDPVKELADMARVYDLQIITVDPKFPVQTNHGAIDGKPADPKQIENYATLFRPEFTLYPISLVKRSQLKQVVFCTELYFAGQRRSAVPDFAHNTLYLDVVRGAYDKTYLRRVMHHEFFHIIDYRDDGELYTDARWTLLNGTGFKYGSGGINAQGLSNTSLLSDQFPGFLNHYSTTGVEEDKAELFAFLMVDSASVEQRVSRDGVLARKVRVLKELLGRFCADMNGEFWRKVSQR